MSNHSSVPNEQMSKMCEKLFDGQQPTGKEFAEMIDCDARNSQFGETGNFPEGKLTNEDEGEIKFGVTTKDEKVILNFGKPCAWIGMTREQAEELGRLLINRANGIT